MQQTLKKSYSFEGKGLHTGKMAKMTLNPAPADTGIRFRRIDIGEDAFIDALADNVSSTARSTTLSCGKASVTTIEHVLSALTGMGVDNAVIDIDNVEVPILESKRSGPTASSSRMHRESTSRSAKPLKSPQKRKVHSSASNRQKSFHTTFRSTSIRECSECRPHIGTHLSHMSRKSEHAGHSYSSMNSSSFSATASSREETSTMPSSS